MLPPAGCTCAGKSPRCPACVSEHVRHFGGSAELRGSLWADRIVRKRPDLIALPFPETPKAFGMARKLVDDIAKADDGITNTLATRVIVGARRQSTRLADPVLREQIRSEKPGKRRR